MRSSYAHQQVRVFGMRSLKNDKIIYHNFTALPIDGESASVSERESLRTLSAAIAQRQRSEAEAEAYDAALEGERGGLLQRALALDARLTRLLHALRLAAALAAARGDPDSTRLAAALR